jgi:hypothetical protein
MWLPIANFIVQCLLFVGLTVYTVVTWRILGASRKQIEVSQEQVEAAQKPCLMFSTTLRAPEDAILEMGGTDSAMMILCPQAQAQLENIGNGPTVNARYSLTPINPASTVARPSSYLVTVLSGQKILTPIPRGTLQGNDWEIVLSYESLAGRKYRTRITANNLVLTDIKFEQV